jgi:Electron transfer DM13
MKTLSYRTFLALAILVLALAACAPAATPTPAPTEVMPEPTEVMPEPTETMPEATEAMPEPTETMAEPTEAMAEPTEAMAEPTEAMAEPTEAMADATEMMHEDMATLTGMFVKEEVPASGSYTLDPAAGQLVFSDDFTVSTGPDLYIILSGASDLSVDYVAFGQMVVKEPKVTLGALASPSGGQTYTVPEGTDLSQYHSIVVWCQSFNVAFAAAPLMQ